MPAPSPASGLVVAIGGFDGVHLGHQEILRRTRAIARARAGVPAVLTFDPLPAQLVCPDFTFVLTPLPERARLLARLGIQLVHVVRFDAHLRATGAGDFVRSHVLEPLRPAAVVVGHDHRFGSRGEGDPDLLNRLLAPAGVRVEVVPEFVLLDAPVRSTRVREHLLLGHVRLAGELLGRPYAVSGPVVPGTGTGRRLGFPTLNVHVPEREKLVPADGVYAALVQLDPRPPDRSLLPAAVNIGHRPTFGGERRAVEAHVIGGLASPPAAATLHFVDRMRPELRFDSAAALAAQIADDVRAAAGLLAVRPAQP